jgi:hypothetical protein
MFDISSQQNNGDKDKPIVDKRSKMKVKTNLVPRDFPLGEQRPW